MAPFRFYLGVFFLTSATLMLELVQTRILSVVAWYHLAFFVISLSMFGLTAGAVWVYLKRDRFREETLAADLTYFTAAFAAVTALSLAVQMTLVPVAVHAATLVVIWAELAVCVAAPFFCAGVAVSLALTRSPYPIGRVYGVDLLGAATGCLGVLLLLHAMDGPSAMLGVAAVAAMGAVCFATSGIGEATPSKLPIAATLARPMLLLIVLVLGTLANSLTPYGLRPVAVKGQFEDPTSSLLFEKWNSFSRVAVFRKGDSWPQMWGASPNTPFDRWTVQQMELNIDGDAGTMLYRFGGDPKDAEFLRYDVTNLAYYLPDRERGAVIGVGGGRDVLSAWIFGVREITGVELNPIFIELLTREPRYRDFANLHHLPGVRFVVDEARSWFSRTDQAFDIIQMSLVDTWAATGAGAFTLSENGLYTVEAWHRFLRRLTPEGVFTVSRWYAPGDVNETGRMVSLAVAALLEMGVATPQRHLFLATSDHIATLVVSRSPLTPANLAALEKTSARLAYHVLIGPTAEVGSDVLGRIVNARTRTDLDRSTAGLALDLTPPTDDRPFFFNMLPFHQPWQVYRTASQALSVGVGGVAQGNLLATATLMVLFVVSTGLVLVTIILPLRPAVRDVGGWLAAGGTAYFLLIGVGFMAVEIGLLQRLSVFLGHPMYSLSVTLFTLILTTGVGSLVSDRFPLVTRSRFIAWAALTGGYVISLTLWLPTVLVTFDSVGLLFRAVLGVLTLAPAGFLFGFGFPTGMRLISAVDRTPTPWFWGVNGAAGVLAAILAVVTSIAFGIQVTLIGGALCYLLLVPVVLLTGMDEPMRREAAEVAPDGTAAVGRVGQGRAAR